MMVSANSPVPAGRTPVKYHDGRRGVGVQQTDKRRYPRLNLRFPIYVKRSGGKNSDSEERRAETANVSSGGVLVKTSRRLDIGERVEVSITVPYTVWNRFPTVKVEAGAEVLRVSAVPSIRGSEKKNYRTALQFDEPLRTIVW